jgi:hypothetical protein
MYKNHIIFVEYVSFRKFDKGGQTNRHEYSAYFLNDHFYANFLIVAEVYKLWYNKNIFLSLDGVPSAA